MLDTEHAEHLINKNAPKYWIILSPTFPQILDLSLFVAQSSHEDRRFSTNYKQLNDQVFD